MRQITNQDVIATWLVIDEKEDASLFPQSGHDSSSLSFQNIYWRCVLCFFVTALRQAPQARLIFFTNSAVLPNIDEVSLSDTLRKIGVDIVVLPINHRLPKGRAKSWNNQFYILDIIRYSVANFRFDTLSVLDSDCVWVRSPETMMADVERRGALTLSLAYAEDHVLNGATRCDLLDAAQILTDQHLQAPPHYSGGEIFSATFETTKTISEMSERMWTRISDPKLGPIKVFEEGHFLSIIYEVLDIPTGTADPHCRRMWTAVRLNNVTAEDTDSGRCIWHLPMEKKTGFFDLFHIAANPKSWLWTDEKDQLRLKIARVMGIPKRTPRQSLKAVWSRAHFYVEKVIGN